MADFLDGTLSHDSLIWVWFLTLTPGYCPISSSSLHFFKKKKRKKKDISFLLLSHLFRVPNLCEKVIVNYRAHASWCSLLGWNLQKLHEGKRNQEKGMPRANICIVPGSTIFPLAAGLIIQLLKKLLWKEKRVNNRASKGWQYLIYSKENIFAPLNYLALITKSGSLTALSPH